MDKTMKSLLDLLCISISWCCNGCVAWPIDWADDTSITCYIYIYFITHFKTYNMYHTYARRFVVLYFYGYIISLYRRVLNVPTYLKVASQAPGYTYDYPAPNHSVTQLCALPTLCGQKGSWACLAGSGGNALFIPCINSTYFKMLALRSRCNIPVLLAGYIVLINIISLLI